MVHNIIVGYGVAEDVELSYDQDYDSGGGINNVVGHSSDVEDFDRADVDNIDDDDSILAVLIMMVVMMMMAILAVLVLIIFMMMTIY